MRAKEFILEAGMKKMHKNHSAALKNTITFPDQNPSTGSSYLNYRMGIALAGAPEYPTKADNYIAGDPLFNPYTEEELAMVNFAAKQVGSKGKQTWSSKRSDERSDTNKTSPTAQPKKNRYGV